MAPRSDSGWYEGGAAAAHSVCISYKSYVNSKKYYPHQKIAGNTKYLSNIVQRVGTKSYTSSKSNQLRQTIQL